jgi:anti-sigma factor RsiW
MDLHDLTAAYALDALDPTERDEYEGHLATCARCRDELAEFWQVSGSLAHAAGGPAPPAALRERILVRARSERPGRSPGNVVPFRRRLTVPALSSVAAVAAVLALGFGLWGNSLSRQLDDVRGQRAGEAEAVAILSDPSRQEVALSGANGRLVVSNTGRAAMVLSGVDRAPDGKTYEIWVIERGTPKPAGLFQDARTRTVLTLSRPVPDDAIVAVTVERRGGVSLPTGTPIITSPPV